jgi:hypothetical protein
LRPYRLGQQSQTMQRILTVAAFLSLAAGAAHAGGARQARYAGIHPVPASEGGQTCYIQVPHVHAYAVARADRVQYRDHRGSKFFVGDPVAYGYDGPVVTYKGHHPIDVELVVDDGEAGEPDIEFCYLDGPHFHAFAPPEGPEFKLTGGAYFYVGTPPAVYVEARPAMIEINAIYRPLVYARPVVTVAAPVGWIGAHVDVVAPAVVVPRVVIPSPAVQLDVGIGIGFGAGIAVDGPVFVGGGRGKHKHRHKHKHPKRGKWKR